MIWGDNSGLLALDIGTWERGGLRSRSVLKVVVWCKVYFSSGDCL